MRSGSMSSSPRALPTAALLEYMGECRELVLSELEAIVPERGALREVLYDLVFDYPLREAKALRPAVAIAVCRAFGGALEGVLKSATVVELYHNAFLIHDDVEDGSELRRDAPTLHTHHGVPVAINVGDAMLALALRPLLDNVADVGLGKALRIIEAVSVMARESAEGQAVELSWIKSGQWSLRDKDYLRMVHKKTAYYTFITPAVIGGIVAGCSPEELTRLRLFSTALGSAFQIQDDILNLVAKEGRYGKEALGDLWEGKHTLILMHALRSATDAERERALVALSRQRPLGHRHVDDVERALMVVERLRREQELSEKAFAALSDVLVPSSEGRYKTEADVQFLLELIERHQSLEHARSVARARAERARRMLDRLGHRVASSEHLAFLYGLVEFVTDREH